MNASSNDPWSIQTHAAPPDGSASERLRFLVHYAILAPSAYNLQPWRFRLRDDRVDVCVDAERTLAALDPHGREAVMSCGAALFHLRIAAHHFGFAPVVDPWPTGVTDAFATDAVADQAAGETVFADAPCVARVGLRAGHAGTLQEHRLFTAIKKRRTHRGAFDDTPVPDADVERLVRGAESEGAALVPLRTSTDRKRLAELVALADRRLAQSAAVREAWTQVSAIHGEATGVPSEARGWGAMQSLAAPLWMRLPGGTPRQALPELERVEDAPLLVVLATAGDTPRDWLDAGQALDRVLLQACTYGLFASFLNQTLLLDAVRGEVATLAGARRHPHAVLRVGYDRSFRAPPTPRRPVEAVLDTV